MKISSLNDDNKIVFSENFIIQKLKLMDEKYKLFWKVKLILNLGLNSNNLLRVSKLWTKEFRKRKIISKLLKKNYTLSEKKKMITRKLLSLNYFRKHSCEHWKILRKKNPYMQSTKIYKLYDETTLYFNFNLKVFKLLQVLISRSSELKILGPS